MKARVYILDSRNLLVSDHELKMDSEYLFPIEGGLFDEETGYHLLGYKVTGIWSARKELQHNPGLVTELLAKIDELTVLLRAGLFKRS